MTAELFVCTVHEPGMLVRLERIRRGWRQVDVASAARVTQAEVSALERGLQVVPVVKKRVFQVLELDIEEG